MKPYEDYEKTENFISLGQLSVYNDFIKSSNLKANYKMWDGSKFLLLANADVDELMSEEFEDYKSYFEIILIKSNILKKDNDRFFNIYKLKYKE